ncbi:hypothetical protein N658DRAFT_187568 [Parathielavia hyrcaniae]|uniref:Uncharacterized protein n=1 Tax=Parathielavia hyrcaniae TaxID=113614 RepID=A0AAN6Q6Y4_9PEZI|nr:hypothetical protein N658DRAFT_187568 [Parathielavia hyrcaniae]
MTAHVVQSTLFSDQAVPQTAPVGAGAATQLFPRDFEATRRYHRGEGESRAAFGHSANITTGGRCCLMTCWFVEPSTSQCGSLGHAPPKAPASTAVPTVAGVNPIKPWGQAIRGTRRVMAGCGGIHIRIHVDLVKVLALTAHEVLDLSLSRASYRLIACVNMYVAIGVSLRLTVLLGAADRDGRAGRWPK